jgi:hypothetical protein
LDPLSLGELRRQFLKKVLGGSVRLAGCLYEMHEGIAAVLRAMFGLSICQPCQSAEVPPIGGSLVAAETLGQGPGS